MPSLIAEKLYVVGGSDGQTSLKSVETFDFTGSGSWSAAPSLGTPRASMGVAVLHRRLFAVGGFGGKSFLNTMEYLSDDGDEWCSYQPNIDVSDVSSESAAAPELGTVMDLVCNGDVHDDSTVEESCAGVAVHVNDEASTVTTALTPSSPQSAPEDEDSEAEL